MDFQVSDDVKIDASAGRRLLMWAVTWKAINDSPKVFWTGFGFSNYRWEFGHAIKLFFYTPAAHNVYLHMWAETGLVGLLLYLLVFAAMIVFAFRQRKAHPPGLLLGALAIGVLSTGFTQETFFPNEAQSNFPVLLTVIFLAFILNSRACHEINDFSSRATPRGLRA
jgi:O-antigen ligase